MKLKNWPLVMVWMVLNGTASLVTPAFAEETEPDAGDVPKKKVNLEAIKKQYSETGGEVRAVQNRIYSKARRFEVGFFGGLISVDPFLEVRNAGLLLGYHLSEFASFQLLGWRDLVKGSRALGVLTQQTGNRVNSNDPHAYIGGEGVFNLIYGKLTLMGMGVMHFDMHLTLGSGMRLTESGDSISQTVGIGQQFYLSRSLALRADYRIMHYREKVLDEGDLSPTRGQVIQTRSAFSNIITLGLSWLF